MLNQEKNSPEQNEDALPGGNPENGERFESDTQKLVRRHLEDPDHVITEEEMKNIRVGMSPPDAERNAIEMKENEDKIDETEKKILGDTDQKQDDSHPRDERITPWDTIDEG